LDAFSKFKNCLNRYNDSSPSDGFEKITENAKMVSVYGQLIAQSLNSSDFNSEIKSKKNSLLNVSSTLRAIVEEATMAPINEELFIKNELESFKSVKKELEKISEGHIAFDERIKKLIGENEKKVLHLEGRVDSLNEVYEEKLSDITKFYERSLENINEKDQQLNNVLGEVASRVIAQDYDEGAKNEMITADWLRYGSIFFMIVIVFIVAFSFWESTQSEFDLQASIFRLVLACIISIPAAYLARESAKHRVQQYSYLQTALDLKAISPYLASLPDNESNRIKAEMANRIFAVNKYDSDRKESFPINTHELLMEIIKKLEFNKNK